MRTFAYPWYAAAIGSAPSAPRACTWYLALSGGRRLGVASPWKPCIASAALGEYYDPCIRFLREDSVAWNKYSQSSSRRSSLASLDQTSDDHEIRSHQRDAMLVLRSELMHHAQRITVVHEQQRHGRQPQRLLTILYCQCAHAHIKGPAANGGLPW